ncbi:hypothetical protein Vadar_012489 [Vaccinium darrowii]|nr:hypothetical protein Vadar_012489 [Vaccinium darrowii]
MPVAVVVPDTSTIEEHNGCSKPRNQQPISETDPNNSQQIPCVIQSTRCCKSSISSLLLSTTKAAISTPKKKMNYFTPPGPFRRLGCVAVSSHVTEPETTTNKKKKKKHNKKNKVTNQVGDRENNINASSASVVVVPDVFCGPGIGLNTDAAAAAVDRAVLSTRPVSPNKMNQRERPSFSTGRTVNPEPMSFMDSNRYFEMRRSELDVFGSRYRRRIRHPSPEGFAEMMMLRSSLMMGERSDGFDRYRDWRLNFDNMSYEELLELGDSIGFVNTGLKEDEIVHCLRKTKVINNLFSLLPTEMERKCSICQEDYEEDDEVGKLECGHFYHIHCVKQWLMQKNTCPICKTTASTQE